MLCHCEERKRRGNPQAVGLLDAADCLACACNDGNETNLRIRKT